MKNVLFLTILITFSLNCYAQTFQPTKQKLTYLTNSIYLDENSDFQQNGFKIGWHWYSGYKMSQALGINQIHVYTEVPEYRNGPSRYINPNLIDTLNSRFAENARMIMSSSWIGDNYPAWNPRHARALHYNPIIKSNEMNDTTFDATNGFIGFKNVHNTTTIDSLRLILDKNTTKDTIVLSEPLLADRFTTK